jgi:uncharacterized membrane protein
MTTVPPPTLYQRWLGWHASADRKVAVVAAIGLIVTLVLLLFVTWGIAVVAGWDAAALAFLISIWSTIIRADRPHTERLASRKDPARGALAEVLLLGASVASLVGVGFALSLAGGANGPRRVLFIGVAVLTVLLSWTVVNTVYTLRYAILHFRSSAVGIAFGDPVGQEQPTFQDFAYVAFTIGMCYQVSDTTVRDPRIRRVVLSHAMLSYLFGVVIVGGLSTSSPACSADSLGPPDDCGPALDGNHKAGRRGAREAGPHRSSAWPRHRRPALTW